MKDWLVKYQIKKGQRLSPKTEFKKGSIPSNYKGDGAGYVSKHNWVYRRMGKARKCEECGKESHVPKMIHWANISGKYKRDIRDWKQLCAICHKYFDKQTKIDKEEAALIKIRYKNGESQRFLSKEFNVSQMTISRITSGKTNGKNNFYSLCAI